MAQDNSTAGVIKPPFPVDSVPWEPWSQGKRFGGRVRRLGKFGGGAHVGVLIEELPPGMQSCPLHYHMLEEEHLLMLEGKCTLRLGDKTYDMAAGDYICFPAGQDAGRCMVNNSATVCRYLVVGERNPNEVVVYPDSVKVLVALTGELYRKSATMEFWDGEDSGSGIDLRG